jgi:hypothetical protein
MVTLRGIAAGATEVTEAPREATPESREAPNEVELTLIETVGPRRHDEAARPMSLQTPAHATSCATKLVACPSKKIERRSSWGG